MVINLAPKGYIIIDEKYHPEAFGSRYVTWSNCSYRSYKLQKKGNQKPATIRFKVNCCILALAKPRRQ